VAHGSLHRDAQLRPVERASGHVARLAVTSVTHGRVLQTREPSFISTAHDLWREPCDTCQHRSSPLRRVRSGAEGRVSASEPSLTARQGPVLRDAWQRRTPTRWRCRVRSLWTHDSAEVFLGEGEGSGALDTWQRRKLP
jgi:hypothetical protein